jgi:hypothetical protein
VMNNLARPQVASDMAFHYESVFQHIANSVIGYTHGVGVVVGCTGGDISTTSPRSVSLEVLRVPCRAFRLRCALTMCHRTFQRTMNTVAKLYVRRPYHKLCAAVQTRTRLPLALSDVTAVRGAEPCGSRGRRMEGVCTNFAGPVWWFYLGSKLTCDGTESLAGTSSEVVGASFAKHMQKVYGIVK